MLAFFTKARARIRAQIFSYDDTVANLQGAICNFFFGKVSFFFQDDFLVQFFFGGGGGLAPAKLGGNIYFRSTHTIELAIIMLRGNFRSLNFTKNHL